MVDEDAVRAFLSSLDGVDELRVRCTSFFYYDPDRSLDRTRHHPFATVVADDEHDAASRLSRPGVFRVNVGVGREAYRARFGPEPPWGDGGPVATGHDFAALDAFLPHPVYAPLSWICVLCPERTWAETQAYLREAHARAKERYHASTSSRSGTGLL